MHWADSTGALARLTLLNYNTKIIIIVCRKVQFRQTDISQSGEALELKILYEQETAMRAACSNRDLIVFFATSQALASWTFVSGIKWPKQPISMEMRLTDKPES